MKKEYAFTPGCQLSGNAQDVGEELAAIQAKNPANLLERDDVWKSAKRKKSTLHTYFTWDKEKAVIKCWRLEATKVIRSVKLVVRTENKEPIRVRAFAAMDPDTVEHTGYMSIEEMMLEYPDEMLERAKRELRRVRAQYADLVELAEIFQLVDAL